MLILGLRSKKTIYHKSFLNGASIACLYGACSPLYRPIHDAIEIGCLELVKLLIDYKADLMVEYGERTAVEFAMDQNELEIASYIKG